MRHCAWSSLGMFSVHAGVRFTLHKLRLSMYEAKGARSLAPTELAFAVNVSKERTSHQQRAANHGRVKSIFYNTWPLDPCVLAGVINRLGD